VWTIKASPGGGGTTLGGGTAISGGGTPDTGGGTPLRPVPAEFNYWTRGGGRREGSEKGDIFGGGG